MVKIFTMVKDENDIVEDWVIYHGSMFGFENLYIIDNYSTDGTYEILVHLSLKTPINIFRLNDYSLKGQYMTEFIEKYGKEDKIAYPIDIDEFVVLYNKVNNTISIDKEKIMNYIDNLPEYKVYKTNYIMAKNTVFNGHSRSTTESTHACYADYGEHAKSFFNTKLFENTIIDHGNHFNCSDYYPTDICLVHYHCRNKEQMKKKILNNVLGLGYKNDIQFLKNLLLENPDCCGNHHVKYQILVLENKFNINISSIDRTDILLYPLADRIRNGFF
jgi:hypothetical protein